MSELFRRYWDIRVGTVRVSGEGAGGGSERATLDCAFEVEKSTAREPNTASVKIWNLSPSHRRALEQTSTLALRIDAGYVGNHGVSTFFPAFDIAHEVELCVVIAVTFHKGVGDRIGGKGLPAHDDDRRQVQSGS